MLWFSVIIAGAYTRGILIVFPFPLQIYCNYFRLLKMLNISPPPLAFHVLATSFSKPARKQYCHLVVMITLPCFLYIIYKKIFCFVSSMNLEDLDRHVCVLIILYLHPTNKRPV